MPRHKNQKAGKQKDHKKDIKNRIEELAKPNRQTPTEIWQDLNQKEPLSKKQKRNRNKNREKVKKLKNIMKDTKNIIKDIYTNDSNKNDNETAIANREIVKKSLHKFKEYNKKETQSTETKDNQKNNPAGNKRKNEVNKEEEINPKKPNTKGDTQRYKEWYTENIINLLKTEELNNKNGEPKRKQINSTNLHYKKVYTKTFGNILEDEEKECNQPTQGNGTKSNNPLNTTKEQKYTKTQNQPDETVTMEDCEDDVEPQKMEGNPPKSYNIGKGNCTKNNNGENMQNQNHTQQTRNTTNKPNINGEGQKPRNNEELKNLNLSQKWNILQNANTDELIVMELNVQGGLSSKAKRLELADIARTTDADVMVITEHQKGLNKSTEGDHKYETVHNDKFLKIEGYWNISKQRQSGKGGGVAIYWKKTIDAEAWEGADLPDNLKEAGIERLWIKVKGLEGEHAIGGAYMPNEYHSFRDNKKTEKFGKILQILKLDITKLGETPFDILGDFNAHMGDSHSNGIPGNNHKVGKHGHLLQTWLKENNLTLVNSHTNLTQGIWTRQQGTSKSALDLVIKKNKDLSKTSALIIDDDREITTLNTDHNMLITIIKAKTNPIQWEPATITKWDTKEFSKNKYRKSLTKQFKEEVESENTINQKTNLKEVNIEKSQEQLKDTILKAMNKSSKLINMANKIKHPLPKEVTQIKAQIKEKEKIKSQKLKSLMGQGPYPKEIKEEIHKMEEEIQELHTTKSKMCFKKIMENNQKINKVIKKQRNK